MSVIAPDTVVFLGVEFYDAHGMLLEAPEAPIVYLHGGYGGLLEPIERALEGRCAGEFVQVHLEPEEAFGYYDAALVRVEARSRYGDGLEVGMEVEDTFDDAEHRRYTVTDMAGGKVVLDANHPLAGIALRIACRVLEVRAASAEEVRRGEASA